MGSSSSDHDSFREVDDSELSEEYDDSVWHDKDCWRPFEEPVGVSGSKLCPACRSLFSGCRETEVFYKHYYRLLALRSTADRGCQLCTLVRSKVDRETKNHSPSEVLRLTFVMYQADMQDGITAFEIWFHFLRVCKGPRYGDVVWGIKTIDFVLSEDVDDAVVSSHEITSNSQSQENCLLAKRWLSNCMANHESCNNPRTRPNWMPTRLLDVSSARTTASTVFLVDGTSIPSDLEYISLSHCWGSKPVISLSQTNIESLKRGISISDLPKTYQDALIVGGWLQCQYLWIDSLCIIQDSVEDWQRESAEMRHVYKNARLNIAATGAVDSSVGLFFDRDPSIVSTGLVSVSWDGNLPKGTFRFFLRHIWAHSIGRAPLSRRAWVVQERFLARRNLHFGLESMFFECHELEACETFPGRLPAFFQRQSINRFKDVYPSTDPNPTARAISFLKSWQKIVHAYMQCDLTYASDKMIALSGIAEEFRSIRDDVYLAGLWKDCFFIEQLLWSVRYGNKQVNGQPSMRPSVYRAPSWSWLSIDANIEFVLNFEPSFIDIVEASVRLVNDNSPTGQVEQGALSICGQLERASFKKKPNKRADFYLYDDNNNRVGLMTIAFDEAAIRPTEGFCMPVRFVRDLLEGLLLIPTGEKPMEFKRVGYFQSDNIETHKKLVQENKADKIIFTIV